MNRPVLSLRSQFALALRAGKQAGKHAAEETRRILPGHEGGGPRPLHIAGPGGHLAGARVPPRKQRVLGIAGQRHGRGGLFRGAQITVHLRQSIETGQRLRFEDHGRKGMVFHIAVAHQHGFLGKDLGNAVELAHLIGASSPQCGQEAHQLRIGVGAHGHGGQRDAGPLHRQGDVLKARIGGLAVGEKDDVFLGRLGGLKHAVGLIQRGIESRAAVCAQSSDQALHILQAAHALEGHHPFGRIVEADHADVVELAEHLHGAHGGFLGRFDARSAKLPAGHAA